MTKICDFPIYVLMPLERVNGNLVQDPSKKVMLGINHSALGLNGSLMTTPMAAMECRMGWNLGKQVVKYQFYCKGGSIWPESNPRTPSKDLRRVELIILAFSLGS